MNHDSQPLQRDDHLQPSNYSQSHCSQEHNPNVPKNYYLKNHPQNNPQQQQNPQDIMIKLTAEKQKPNIVLL